MPTPETFLSRMFAEMQKESEEKERLKSRILNLLENDADFRGKVAGFLREKGEKNA